jgi:hypothetical protein
MHPLFVHQMAKARVADAHREARRRGQSRPWFAPRNLK